MWLNTIAFHSVRD